MIGFSLPDAKRIINVVRGVEKMPKRTTLPYDKNSQTVPRFHVRGVLETPLTKGGSATMNVMRWDGSNNVDTGEDLTVYDCLLKIGVFA